MFGFTELRRLLQNHLYGQHIVQDVLVNAIGAHFDNIQSSRKPLVMRYLLLKNKLNFWFYDYSRNLSFLFCSWKMGLWEMSERNLLMVAQ